jgi:ribosomal-protein-serine acetyltransferase
MDSFFIDDHIELKPIDTSDASFIFETINNEREYLRKWLPFVDKTYSYSDSLYFVNSILSVSEEYREPIFSIYYDHQFAGIIGFRGTDITNHKTEIGYWLSQKYQKKGIITRSIPVLLKYVFNPFTWNMNRVQIRCAVENYRSRAIPEKLGFRLEGIERAGELLVDDAYTDLAVYSLLMEESINKTIQ